MRGRFSLTTSPMKKAPSIYKRKSKTKAKKNLKNSPYQPQPIPEFKTERLFEEKLTPKSKTARATTNNSNVQSAKDNNVTQTPNNYNYGSSTPKSYNNTNQTPRNANTIQTPRNANTIQTPRNTNNTQVPRNNTPKNNTTQTPSTRPKSPRSPPNFEAEDTFFVQPQEHIDIDELKAQYEELVRLYNDELAHRDELRNDCETLEQNLQQAYKDQSRLSHQIKKKYQM